MNKIIKSLLIVIAFCSCEKNSNMEINVFETSRNGNKLSEIKEFQINENLSEITLNTSKKFQTITGFGGAFTESSAYLLNQMSKEKRQEILDAYFSEKGSNYSLTRTHMNSCDFSISNYSYSPVEGDVNLKYFSVKEDMR